MNILNFECDEVGQLKAASDDNSSYSYEYDNLGRLKTIDNDGTSGVPNVVLTSVYDSSGNRTSLKATVDSADDFANAYQYDGLNRQTRITQTSVLGDYAVADKRIDIGYDPAGAFDKIKRYSDLTATTLVASSVYGYDDTGRLQSLTHTASDNTTTYADYAWTFDVANRIKSFTNSANYADYSAEDIGNYGYDAAGQLQTAAPPGGGTPNAANSLSNTYDSNGNRTNVGDMTDAGNRFLSDGMFDYTYDANGHLIQKVSIAYGDEVDYAYDIRNRLTTVTNKDSLGTTTQVVTYTYDMFNILIGKTHTPYSGGAPGTTVTTRFVYDGQNMIEVFDGTGALTHRYLDGPAVDQVFADEQFDPMSSGEMPIAAGETEWTLTDNQGTVRNVIDSSDNIDLHTAFNAFGNPVSHAGSLTMAFGFTGKFYDADTGLQWNINRWYDPVLQRWMSEDPLGLGPDVDPYRYVGNGPTNATDERGLLAGASMQTFGFVKPPPPNQVPSVGENELTFDNNGNTTTDEQGRILIYDAWNRLIEVQDDEEYSLVSYSYDGLSRRTTEDSGTPHELYYSTSWQVVEERDSGIAVLQNIWSPVHIDAILLRDHDANASTLDGREERLYALYDANYNVTAVVDGGDIRERYVYDPYGAVGLLPKP
ncbi:MAG: RHS repeat-associated core domain-containing protein [Planctomycetes bacterium]|nr:RHS repeat-associated core domain-containing protein [Planctomycetota bacterium]